MTCRLVFLAPLLVASFASAADERPLERTLKIDGSRIEVTVRGTPGQETAFWRWIDDSARAVSGYFGRFPVPRVRLAVRIVRGGRIGSGVTIGWRRPLDRRGRGQRRHARHLAPRLGAHTRDGAPWLP